MFKSDFFPSEKASRAMLPGKIARTAIHVAAASGIRPREALSRFYASPTSSPPPPSSPDLHIAVEH